MTHHVDLDEIILSKGSHDSVRDGTCMIEAAALFAGEPHSDHSTCVDPIVAAYCRPLNDLMPDAERQRLKAYIPRVVGTVIADPRAAAYRLADHAARVSAVTALRRAGLGSEADKLAALPPVVDFDTASAAAAAARAAYDAAEASAAAEATVAAAAASVFVLTAHVATAARAYDAGRAAANAASAAAEAARAAGEGEDGWAPALAMLDELCAMAEGVTA